MGQNREKLPCPQNSNFRLPRGHRFRPKFDFMVMASNHSGDPLGSILGPMGSHWVKKWVKSGKNYHAQNSNFRLTHGHRFRPKLDFTVMAPNHTGDPLGYILVPLVKKMGQNRKKLPCPKFEFLTTLRSSISAKIRLDRYGAKSQW